MTDALHPLERLVQRAELLMARIEQVLPQPMAEPDWSASVAFRYRKRSSGRATLEPVRHVAAMTLADLKKLFDEQFNQQVLHAVAPSCTQARGAIGKPSRWRLSR